MVARVAVDVLPIESGDRLTQLEFHRRYEASPHLWAELVEGVVYVASPVRVTLHGEPHAFVMAWLGVYKAKAPEVHIGDNTTVRLDADNEVQPDGFLWREEPDGPRISPHDYLEGAPQLVVEVAASSVSYDLHDKMRAYRRNGVREYIVWRVLDRAIDWFCLSDGEYIRVEPDARGIIESSVFPGLRLNISKMLSGDLGGVIAALND